MLKYFVMDSISHAMDGFYVRRDVAEEQLTYMRETYPNGLWFMGQVLQGDARITDEFFHVNRFKDA